MGRVLWISAHGDVDLFASPERASAYVEALDVNPGDLVVDEDGVSYAVAPKGQSVTLSPNGKADWEQVRARVEAHTSVPLPDENGTTLLDALVLAYGLSY